MLISSIQLSLFWSPPTKEPLRTSRQLYFTAENQPNRYMGKIQISEPTGAFTSGQPRISHWHIMGKCDSDLYLLSFTAINYLIYTIYEVGRCRARLWTQKAKSIFACHYCLGFGCSRTLTRKTNLTSWYCTSRCLMAPSFWIE